MMAKYRGYIFFHVLSFQRRLLIKGTLIDFNTQTPYSHKLQISTRSTFKLCFKNEVLWQIILLETGNPFTFSITGHPTLAVENSSAQWSLIFPCCFLILKRLEILPQVYQVK